MHYYGLSKVWKLTPKSCQIKSASGMNEFDKLYHVISKLFNMNIFTYLRLRSYHELCITDIIWVQLTIFAIAVSIVLLLFNFHA